MTTDTILLYGNDYGIIEKLENICKERGVSLSRVQSESDFINHDYKIAFIDHQLFSESLAKKLNDIANFKNNNEEWGIVIIGGQPENIPIPLERFCTIRKWHYGVNFLNEIVNYYTKQKIYTSKSDQFKSRIKRIVYLYHLIEQNHILYNNDLCELFEITERTLFRDLKIIKELFPDKHFHCERKTG